MRWTIATVVALVALLGPSPARAEFGLSEIDVSFVNEDGSPAMQAGSHPFAMKTSFKVNTREGPGGVELVDGALRSLEVAQAAGFVGNRTAVPRCQTLDFLTSDGAGHPSCADSTAVGTLSTVFGAGLGIKAPTTAAIYNLQPSPGVAAKLGFWISDVAVSINVGAQHDSPYKIVASLANTSQVLEVFESETILWGNPADPAHDADRGACAYESVKGSCPADIPVQPFLTLPRSCGGPLLTVFRASSWWSGDPLEPDPPAFFEGVSETHDDSVPPNPLGTSGCSKLGFAPRFDAQPTTDRAESPSGLDVGLEVQDEGIGTPGGIAHSDIAKAVLTLPEGVTLNPSAAEGLAACSTQDLARETPSSNPGEGCPEASKLGTVEVETPVLEGKILKGAFFLATQDDPATPAKGAENPFDTLIALYMVIKDPELGIVFRLAGKVEPDPRTGQLRTTFDDVPPYPVGRLRAHLREGGRSPLISPPSCGTHTTRAELTPSGDPAHPLTATSSFRITRGVDGGPCPPAGTPPFAPGFLAGTLNNHAGSFSPFYMRLSRRDGDQDLTRFDATLPPGVVAKLAGVAPCPDARIASAKAKTGRQEIASPSCPDASAIGQVRSGAGVGSQLTYVPGTIHLAGPFGGAPLSVVGIVPAVAGPFDVGTVVVRQALQVDPRTAKVEIDGAQSDPIPHILAGIPLRVRDIRVLADRPQFTLNPTSCGRFATIAKIWGGGSQLFSTADDSPVLQSSRFQAADCSRLGFKPRFSLALKGGTRRGDHPALRTAYRPRPGNANLSDLVLRLPRSAFLDQGHIRTICTRVQFAAEACPAAAVYGHATVSTPLLSEPLQGPVYLRSSSHNLPDLVLDLHGLLDIEVSARIDSIKGGIRATLRDIPDAPVAKAVVQMQGGHKGLVVNSRNLCAGRNRARVRTEAHNAKRRTLRPVLQAIGCGRP